MKYTFIIFEKVLLYSLQETFFSDKIYSSESIEGFPEVFLEDNVFRLLFLKYFESKLICSFFGYKSAILHDFTKDKQLSLSTLKSLTLANTAETINCKENSTDISTCKLVKSSK